MQRFPSVHLPPAPRLRTPRPSLFVPRSVALHTGSVLLARQCPPAPPPSTLAPWTRLLANVQCAGNTARRSFWVQAPPRRACYSRVHPRQDPLLLCRNYSSAMQDSASAVGQRPRYQCSSLSLPFHSRVHSTAGILLCCGAATPFPIYMRVHSTAGNLLCCGVATPLFKVCPRSAVCCTATM
jgi:hypothetical protein